MCTTVFEIVSSSQLGLLFLKSLYSLEILSFAFYLFLLLSFKPVRCYFWILDKVFVAQIICESVILAFLSTFSLESPRVRLQPKYEGVNLFDDKSPNLTVRSSIATI